MNAHAAGTEPGDTEHASRRPSGRLDRYFEITARGSTLSRELRGGLVTFFTMAYIVVLNPLIVGTAADATGATLGISQVAAATALVAGVMTVLMGIIGKYPFALATGLGLNAFLATTVAPEMTWADAMGLIVLEGIIILIVVLTGFRTAVFNAVPTQLKTATGVGIGLFIALIGFVDAGFVQRVPDAAGTTVPVQLGNTGQLFGWPSLVFAIGVLLVAVLVTRRVKGAILLGIAATTVLAVLIEAFGNLGQVSGDNPGGWSLVVPEVPTDFIGLPNLSLVGNFSLLGSFEQVSAVAAVLFVFTLMLADFFDTMGTVVGVGNEAGLLDKQGRLPGIGRVFFVDSLAAIAGGAASTSSNTTYVESAAGVGEGARTGLASVVTGVLFLLAMFLTPLVSVVPFEAASPAMVVVGFLMLTQVRSIDFSDFGIAIPAFLTMVLMPFTYSITNGIGAGFVSYVVIRACQGRAREIHPLMWGVSVLFVLYFAIGPLETLLGAG
ncbi:AGZA family xanthine/uracil permease-like MFS transporter [Halopolyspora algeriensis]|uniref:AGZA family xanthine/uracil permease-like MFS transporter n=1 Tax=Halopolyspora algeriensis TaxID=1500506 RepID=A0A368VRW7_9ACTN|nr:NCS2 family permease [Halopolyspora algeriensis]RCW43207.1 AGZA family xanthine/uracil permease-like MFS transporter [Halopolyspora algeriensis]TQM56266.1 AGZA family xanthine/uracil permease-like MFS transporter [Halopolyspora algeriensis]